MSKYKALLLTSVDKSKVELDDFHDAKSFTVHVELTLVSSGNWSEVEKMGQYAREMFFGDLIARQVKRINV